MIPLYLTQKELKNRETVHHETNIILTGLKEAFDVRLNFSFIEGLYSGSLYMNMAEVPSR